MVLTRKALWLCYLIFCTACAQTAMTTPKNPVSTIVPLATNLPTNGTPSIAPLATNTPTKEAVPKTTITPVPSTKDLATFLPRCAGFKISKEPITFDWPNIKKRSQDLADGNWGYFSCSQAPAEVVDFYKTNLVNPPYNMAEVNWIERQEGFLGLYLYQPSYTSFYIWVVPQVDNPSSSNLIIVQVEESIFTPGECYLGSLKLWF
jgi:hypothetical protein